MKFISSFGSILAGLVLCMTAQLAQAAITCTFIKNDPRRPLDLTMALQVATISVPRDMPIGARIYLQTFNQAAPSLPYECDTTTQPDVFPIYIVDGVAGNVVKDFGGPTMYAGKIYDTNIPGIGVAWFGGQNGVSGVGKDVAVVAPTLSPGCTRPAGLGIPEGWCRTGGLRFNGPTMSLFKTGPVQAGTVTAESLGRLLYKVRVGDSALLNVISVKLSGSINIVSSTCKAGDVNVDLGKQKISTLTGIGSATPQVNFVIALTNCPVFAGFYSNSGVDAPTSSEKEGADGVISKGTRVANTLNVRVDPVATPIDAANGVLSVETGAGMATGIGVQLRGPAGEPLALSQPLAVTSTLANSINIILGARYLQTGTTVTAGKANAVATYTIIYQ